MEDWRDPETRNCMQQHECDELRGLVRDLTHKLSSLDGAWEQDQQKQKWRDWVVECDREVGFAINEVRQWLNKKGL